MAPKVIVRYKKGHVSIPKSPHPQHTTRQKRYDNHQSFISLEISEKRRDFNCKYHLNHICMQQCAGSYFQIDCMCFHVSSFQEIGKSPNRLFLICELEDSWVIILSPWDNLPGPDIQTRKLNCTQLYTEWEQKRNDKANRYNLYRIS